MCSTFQTAFQFRNKRETEGGNNEKLFVIKRLKNKNKMAILENINRKLKNFFTDHYI